MALADLGSGSSKRLPLPCGCSETQSFEAGTGSLAARIAKHFPDALVFAVGPLTGTLAPAACLLTSCLPGAALLSLNGHSGMALRRCGLDALVLTGSANTPLGIRVDERSVSFFSLDAETNVPKLRTEILHQSAARDNDPALILAGPAAFAHNQAACICLETGLVSYSVPLATAMAARNLAGISLDGARPFASPVPLKNPAAQKSRAELLTRSTLLAVCKAARKKYSGAKSLTPGRSLACFGCPCPCGFWLPLPSRGEKRHVACTSPAGLAGLLETGAAPNRIAEIFALCDSYGIDPARMTELVRLAVLPESLEAFPTFTAEEEAKDSIAGAGANPLAPTSAREELGRDLGVCPFFLKRQPRLKDTDLLACLAAGETGQNNVQPSTAAVSA